MKLTTRTLDVCLVIAWAAVTAGCGTQASTGTERDARTSGRPPVAVNVTPAIVAEVAGEIVTALTGTVDQAQRLVFLAEKGFELGVKTHLEVQDAQVNLLAAKTNLARAHRDYRVARVALEWVMGTLEP
jgi:hypothetical protein